MTDLLNSKFFGRRLRSAYPSIYYEIHDYASSMKGEEIKITCPLMIKYLSCGDHCTTLYLQYGLRQFLTAHSVYSRRWTCSSRVSSGDLLAKCVTQQNFLYFLQYLLSANFISFLNSIFKFISLSCLHSNIQIKISINTFYKNRIQSRKNGLFKMSFLKIFCEKSNCSTTRLFS